MSTSDTLLLFDAGTGQAQGGRQYQEDRCTMVLPDQFPYRTNDRLVFFAVYDGHGSDLVSEHASRNLHLLLVRRPEFEQGDYEGAIRGALADEDGILLGSFNTQTPEPAVSGSTVALCLVNLSKGDLVVANLGDSHAVLAERDPTTENPYHISRLTTSHKPDTPSEKSRIEEAGGIVNTYSGTARIGALNMSRAIGDLQYKNPINTKRTPRASSSSTPETRGNFLSNEPHMVRLKLYPNRRYVLIIVSDGISDLTDDASLVHHVMDLSSRGMMAGDIAQEVASLTASRPESDNRSCLVALLDGQDT